MDQIYNDPVFIGLRYCRRSTTHIGRLVES
jgi:hypothetical protein